MGLYNGITSMARTSLETRGMFYILHKIQLVTNRSFDQITAYSDGANCVEISPPQQRPGGG